MTDDPGVKDALAFLMTREAAHQLSFEKALQSIRNNYPPGKLPPISEYANTYYNMSEGGEVRGSWNNSDKTLPIMSRIRSRPWMAEMAVPLSA